MIYDLIIIGSGPAGLAAAVYARRAELNSLVLEKDSMSGGQLLITDAVENYPGLIGIDGFSLSKRFRKHAEALGAEFRRAEVQKLKMHNDVKVLTAKQGEEFTARSVIIAAGATHKKLGISGEAEFAGRGVSYCATCDGAFFRGKTTAVIGGGDVACEDALALAGLCKKVYLLHRRDTLRAAKSLQNAVFRTPNIEFVPNTVPKAIIGDEKVTGVSVVTNETEKVISADGVFVAIGLSPRSAVFGDAVELDEGGYIIADESGKTNVPGVFAAGDIRTKPLRQIVTAVSDGANCVYSAERYLNETK